MRANLPLICVMLGLKASSGYADLEFECAGDILDRVDEKRAAKLAFTASQGERGALVVYAKFQGEAPSDTVAPSYAQRFFDVGEPGSFSHFYLAMSGGALSISGAVLDRIYVSRHAASYYAEPDPETGLGKFDVFNEEVLTAVGQDPSVDLGQFDSDGPDGVPNSGDDDGYVDFIFVNLLSVPVGFFRGTATGISSLGFTDDLVTEDIRRSASGDSAGLIRIPGRWTARGGVTQKAVSYTYAVGSMVHEYGHVLGLPDLYDTSFLDRPEQPPEDDSAGIGNWGVMGHGTLGWNGDDGPNPFCVWCRAQLGWMGPDNENVAEVTSTMRDVVIEDVESGGKAFKLGVSDEEYFLVVSRQRSGGHYDRHIPADGLLVWHIDEGCTNTDERHKLVDLECADGLSSQGNADPAGGRDDLDNWAHDASYKAAHGGNGGDATDVFDGVQYTAFSRQSNPNSNSYAGLSQSISSRMGVENIRREGSVMVADFVVDRKVRGHVTADTTWSGEVLVDGDVVVDHSATLTVSPGTIIRCARGDALGSGLDSTRCEFIIYGRLSLEAEATDPIHFASAEDPASDDDWYGIRVVGAQERLDLRYVQVSHAQYGIIQSDLTSDTIWGGTVTVREDVIVHQGVTLAIGPGTIVRFAGSDRWGRGNSGTGCELIVAGTLDAQGAPGRPVALTTLGEAGTDSTWYGIVLGYGGGLKLEYCVIERAQYGLVGVVQAEASLDNTRISGCDVAMSVGLPPDATLRVRNSFILDNGTGMSAVGMGTLLLDRCNVQDNKAGGVLLGGCGLEASDCLIAGNGGPGLEASGGMDRGIVLSRVAVQQNEKDGLRLGRWSGTAELEDCEIGNNQGWGLCGAGLESLVLERVTATANDSGGLSIEGAPIRCSYCEFESNSGWGVSLQEAPGVMEYCTWREGLGLRCTQAPIAVVSGTFDRNSLGVRCVDSAAEIRSCRFEQNDTAAQCVGDVVPGQLTGNSWIDTKNWSVQNMSTTEIDASNNWWGSVDESTITSQIQGPVKWQPYLEYDPTSVPAALQLGRSFPNPFSEQATIPFSLPQGDGESAVALRLYNALGQQVRVLEQEAVPGPSLLTWDAKDQRGREVASGAYWYRIRWEQAEEYGKLLLLRR